ncbi:hypothetical protein ABT160_28385 [Streptomyces sp. NPDC001941]|uniref:hypothetical protein n=1 Tax=Streptomyces sp. NPDC001941 TaxID=3154659 RepID=UPI003329E8A4
MTDVVIEDAERELGVHLPASLLSVLRVHAFPTDVSTSWRENHVPFTEMLGIGRRDGQVSLLDTAYLVDEWGLSVSSGAAVW